MPIANISINIQIVFIGSRAKRRVVKIQYYLVLLHFPYELKKPEKCQPKKKKNQHVMMHPLTDQSGADFFQGFCEVFSCSFAVNMFSGRAFRVM